MFWSARLTRERQRRAALFLERPIEDGDEHLEGSAPTCRHRVLERRWSHLSVLSADFSPVEVVTSSRPARQRSQSVKPHDAFITRQRTALQETLDVFVADELLQILFVERACIR